MKSINILLVFSGENSQENQTKEIWVNKFAQFLEITLFKIFRKHVNISVSNIEEGVNENLLEQTKVLLPIVDDYFLQSDKSGDIIKLFAKKHKHDLEGTDRFEEVILIVHQEIEENFDNHLLEEIRHFDFSKLDLENYLQDITNYKIHSKYESTFWLKMYDLALMIVATQEERAEGISQVEKSKTIYLAKVTPDLRDLRNDIKRDLRRHGFNVIPPSNLVSNEVDIELEIKNDLKNASMSLHLIGQAYGDIVKENKSIIDLQNKIADEHGAMINNQANEDKFYRTIWLDPAMHKMSEELETFVSNINRDIEAKNESEFLQLPFEELKVIVRDKLKNKEDNSGGAHNIIKEKDGANVYLVYDRKDYEVSEDLKKALEEKGFNVSVPVFDGALFDLEPKHIDNLKICDACLVIVDKANDAWLNTKLKDIDRVKGLGRNKPIKAKGVFYFKQTVLNTHVNNGTVVMENNENSVKEILEPFIQKIEV